MLIHPPPFLPLSLSLSLCFSLVLPRAPCPAHSGILITRPQPGARVPPSSVRGSSSTSWGPGSRCCNPRTSVLLAYLDSRPPVLLSRRTRATRTRSPSRGTRVQILMAHFPSRQSIPSSDRSTSHPRNKLELYLSRSLRKYFRGF
jgi:hypothetical protein